MFTQVFFKKLDELKIKTQEDLLMILILQLFKVNIAEIDKYIFITQLYIDKLETYNKAISKTYA